MTMHSPREIYKTGITKLNAALQILTRKKNIFAWMRLISFLSAVAVPWLLWHSHIILAIAALAILLVLFVYTVFKDLDNNTALENTRLLIEINEQEIAAIDHQFTSFPDGSELKPETHAYANDLDIFGRASLYQYINRTTSQQGNHLLAAWLLEPATITVIEERQMSAKELAPQQEWRQQLQAFGKSHPLTLETEQNILKWLQGKNSFINNTWWKLLRLLLPLISCTTLVLYLADMIPEQWFYPLLLLYLAISFGISKKIMPAYARLNKITAELETLSASINWIEGSLFKSKGLVRLKDNFLADGKKASQTINDLKKILARLDYRLNPIVFIPLSIFFFWDLQQIFSLEKWKSKNQQHVSNWFPSLAQAETLSTLGNLVFNHPGWSFPVLVQEDAVFISETMGHPLIPEEKRVDNSFSTKGNGQISLITGSNMAGKSTFLRSAGINIILAMMGAPVCARRLSLSPMKVMSSMRVNDNLEESTSTFYAELKKLKEVIEAVNDNKKVILLLDEILRGTNSADRHTGSAALIRQLVHQKAVGLVATHDLELAKLAAELPGNIHNYHFDVQVANDELFFDYTLKEGICRSMNASLLMKKIGIKL